MTRTPHYIKDFIKEAQLPSHTKFIGYIVHRPDTDEFLSLVEYKDGYENRAWAKIPDLAKIYKIEKKAAKEVKRYGENAIVACLLDTGDQYIVAHDDI